MCGAGYTKRSCTAWTTPVCSTSPERQVRALHADKASDIPHLRKWLWGKHIGVRIARKGVESSERSGRRRWVIERTMSWLTGYRRLNHRYERHRAAISERYAPPGRAQNRHAASLTRILDVCPCATRGSAHKPVL
ncbi:hypothetical protein GCM10010347_50490 [Streptomyces cirratus]|uniref:Transposase n=1 Tax=Streptomyces cirratus TaxID=68187 RepID=A0ABQ3F2Q9_9ACTN|nr:hypothetical protein GCM10010347_50490 [Streptomyces cirratus]